MGLHNSILFLVILYRAYLSSSLPVCAPEKEGGNVWHCYENGIFEPQSNIVTIAEPHPLVIHGALEKNVNSHVNGVYEVTDDVCDGYIRYKHATKVPWMEFNQVRRSWHIKPASSKGTTNAWYVKYSTIFMMLFIEVEDVVSSLIVLNLNF